MQNTTLDGKNGSKWSFMQAPCDATKELDSERLYDLATSQEWLACKNSAPSDIFVELMHYNKIPDPFKKQNETLVQWVGQTGWLYRCDFTCNEAIQEGRHADLVFDGLDTFCSAYLVSSTNSLTAKLMRFQNGEKIHSSDNMFRGYRTSITSLLSASASHGRHTLVFHFRSGQRHVHV